MDQIKILTHTWQEVCGNDHWAVLLITVLRAGEVNTGWCAIILLRNRTQNLGLAKLSRVCTRVVVSQISKEGRRKEGPLMVGGECGQQLLQCVSNEEVGQEE